MITKEVEYSNFNLIEINNILEPIAYRATIEIETTKITTKYLFKKIKTVTHSKVNIASSLGLTWFFEDTGKFTDGDDVQSLFRAYKAKHNLELNKGSK